MFNNEIEGYVNRHKWLVLLFCISFTILYYVTPNSIINFSVFTIKTLILFSLWLIYVIGTNSILLNNKFTRFIGKISMEMYLAQMVIFRVLEKLHLTYIFDNGWISFITMFVLVVVGLILFINLYRFIIDKVKNYFKRKSENKNTSICS